ncbi:MAG: MFS transporter [Rhodospirillaceae bacterium]|nr:MFS transporter [Rhodospirillaceae bacterium]MBT7291413.1 MFS transporter [Rhodospirillaceae bacterium]
MISALLNRSYRHLFAAQVISLMGTGFATVALGLLAYDLAGADAGAVLGTALAIKMVAYVCVAPIVGAFANRLPRRAFLVTMDAVRAAIVMLLPFVDQVWQIYLLIFLLQAASASFIPIYQAVIPDVLLDEKNYTRALSLSRLAYDLESLLSPLLAAALLTVMGFHWLFAGTAIGFILSALLIGSAMIPAAARLERRGDIFRHILRGSRIFLATPRLRGLLALNLAAAAAGAMVIVNSVVYVRSNLDRSEADLAIALAAFGGGSMLAALFLPRLLEKLPDRAVMLPGGALLGATLVFIGLAGQGSAASWPMLLTVWFVLGLGYAAALTPSGRLLRNSSHQEDRPALFAAYFSLSHICWLLTYPLAGWLGASVGLTVAFLALGALAALGAGAAFMLWPRRDPQSIEHAHDDLPPDHPHLRATASGENGSRHSHPFVIDDYHRHWPEQG